MAQNYNSKKEKRIKEVKQTIQETISKEPDSKVTLEKESKIRDEIQSSLFFQERRTDIKLKKGYAIGFVVILVIQLAVMNVIIFLAGYGHIEFDPWNLRVYMGGTLIEVFGVIYVITKHLFPSTEKSSRLMRTPKNE